MTDGSEHLKQAQADHDLLIRIDQTLKGLVTDVKDLKDNLSVRVHTLESRVDALDVETEASKRSFKVIWVGIVVIIIPLLSVFYALLSYNMNYKIKASIISELSSGDYEIKINK